ncbi:HEAT repeat domain-containing protein [Prosthecobacter fusiformis]|nr:HEAT repeat domain-containing protein [Prosthecobacter fusiformis]
MNSVFTIAVIFLGLNLHAIEPQSLNHFPAVPPQVRLHFTNFCLGQYETLWANNELGFTQLASTPGLTPVLLELANRLEAEQEWDGYTRAWGLLAQRTDATESEQLFVRSKLEGLVNRNADPGGTTFKDCALTLLGHYSSPENERILKMYLSDTNGGPLRGNTTREAAESLGRIGTASSIAALRAYAEKHKPAPGGKSRYYETAVTALAQIEARIAAASYSSAPSASSTAQPQHSSAPGTQQHGPQAREQHDPMPWSIVLVTILAATALLWLTVKKRK